MASISLREVSEKDAVQILAWRRKPRVTDLMTTDVPDDLEAQRRWLSSCFDKPSYYHWVIQFQGRDAGLLSVADLDLAKGTTSWGYYVGEAAHLGLGALLPPYFYNWLFESLPIQRIDVEVFATNQLVLDMHVFHGYVRNPERDRVIVKNGVAHDVVALALSDTRWAAQTRFHRFTTHFPVSRWRAAPVELRGDH